MASRPTRSKADGQKTNEESGAKSGGWTKIEKWGRAVHHYKAQPGTKELSFQKGDEFKLFAEAQGWYKAYKQPNNEAGMVPGNYVKVIPEPKPAAAAAAAVESKNTLSPPPPSKQDRTSQKLSVSDVDDALARASRRRGMTVQEVEGEKLLKVKIQELENELKNSEFRHRAELAELKSEQTRLKAQNKKLEEETTVLENKVLLMESAGSFQEGGGDGGKAEVEAELRKEIEQLTDSRKADVAKVSKQWERKMERAQAEIDELQEQVNAAAEKEKSLTAQLKKASSSSGGGGGSEADAALASRVKEAEKENGKLRDEISKLKEMMGGYLDMIEDLKDELDEAKNGAGAGNQEELVALKDEVERLTADAERLRKGEKQLLAEVAELESKEQEQASQLSDLMKTNAAMLKELEKTQRRAQDLENEEEARRAETDELRLKLAEVSEKQSGAEENKQSVVELESRLRAISTEKDALSAALEHLRDEHSDAAAQLEVVRKEFEDEREELSAKISELEQKLKDSESASQKLKAALNKAQEEASKEKTSSKLRANLAVMAEENAALLKQCHDFESQLDRLEAEAEAKSKAVASLSKALTNLIKA